MTTSVTSEQRLVVIIGAGMAGLSCACELTSRNVPFHIYESADEAGGRVRTEVHAEGYLIDRGFQVVLEAYPAFEGLIDINAIEPNRFNRGASIWDGNKITRIQTPTLEPDSLKSLFSNRSGSVSDKRKLAKVALGAKLANWKSVTEATTAANASGTALEFLQAAGFSENFIEHFAKPFWGGISLDRSLSGNAGQLLFTLKMFLEGSAVLPSQGVQALPSAIMAKLPSGSVTFGSSVSGLREAGGRVTGIEVNGDFVAAESVVVATDPLAARALTQIDAIPEAGLGCTTVYLASDRDPGLGTCLLLNADSDHGVNHIAPLSAVASSYAPNGKHLVAAVILDHPKTVDLSQEALTQMARTETARILGHGIEDWTPVATVQVPFSQFVQPPGFAATLPTNRTARPGLYLAGEYTRDSSVNGAILSGKTAGRLVAQDAQFRLRKPELNLA